MNIFPSKVEGIDHKELVDRYEVSPANPALVTLRAKYDVLVLEARLRQSLVTVRSLGSRGLHVAAMEAFKVPAFWSRWCQQGLVYSEDGNTQTYLRSLNQALDNTGVRVLIVSADTDVDLIRSHRKPLERRVHIALAKEPALGIALNKEQTLAIARQLGLRIPLSVLLKDASELKAALREIGLPAVVKPVQSWGWQEQQVVGVKGRLVTTSDEAQKAV